MSGTPKGTQGKWRRGTGNRPPNAADVAARIARKRRRNRVFGMVVAGASYRQVARELGISDEQVRRDMNRALSELDQKSSEQKRALYTARLEGVLLETNNAIGALRELAQASPPDIASSRALALHTRTLVHTIAQLAHINGTHITKVQHEHEGAGGGPITFSMDDIAAALTAAKSNTEITDEVLLAMRDNETGVDAERRGTVTH